MVDKAVELGTWFCPLRKLLQVSNIDLRQGQVENSTMAASFSASILPCPRLWSTPTAVRFTLATTSRSSRRRSSRVSLIVQSSRTAPPQPPGFADHSLHSPSGRDLGSVDEADQDVSPNEEADQATIEKTADNQLLPKVLLLFVAFLWGRSVCLPTSCCLVALESMESIYLPTE